MAEIWQTRAMVLTFTFSDVWNVRDKSRRFGIKISRVTGMPKQTLDIVCFGVFASVT